MNVLSLFDGISCGQVALQRAGIKVDNYYASEIDKYAMQVTMKNHPNTIQLGDIEKWREWNINWKSIDLLLGGTPCQGFSFAGRQLNFDDPRSKLVFVYFDILNHIKTVNPNVLFLLENVKMKKEYQDIISSYLGIEPIEINSSLVSAQNRIRLYWTNIHNIQQPENKLILINDIIENDKNLFIGVNYYKNNNINEFFNDCHDKIIIKQRFQENSQSLQRALKSTRAFDEKSKCLLASMYKGMAANGATNVIVDNIFRMLLPIECERLQTLPDNYTEGISNTQRYKAIGNGWTVDIIAHILKCI